MLTVGLGKHFGILRILVGQKTEWFELHFTSLTSTEKMSSHQLIFCFILNSTLLLSPILFNINIICTLNYMLI